MARRLNISGLLVNMVGVVVLFMFGFPQPDFNKQVGMALEEGSSFYRDGKLITVKQVEDEQESKENRYKTMSIIGLTAVFVGFALQLAASILPTDVPPSMQPVPTVTQTAPSVAVPQLSNNLDAGQKTVHEDVTEPDLPAWAYWLLLPVALALVIAWQVLRRWK